MVPISETGTEMLGMMVAGRLRRNTKITATTSATASTSSKAASLTEARIMPVESCATVTSMPAGRVARRPGSRRMIWSTVLITLAPGWRCTLSTMAGVPLYQAPRSTSCAAWLTRATSRRCTGAPFW